MDTNWNGVWGCDGVVCRSQDEGFAPIQEQSPWRTLSFDGCESRNEILLAASKSTNVKGTKRFFSLLYVLITSSSLLFHVYPAHFFTSLRSFFTLAGYLHLCLFVHLLCSTYFLSIRTFFHICMAYAHYF